MRLLSARLWKTKYTPDVGRLLKEFYLPALECAVRYDRTTGYFSARALAAASRGIEGLVRNRGKMRLIVGCTLAEPEVEAICRGESLKDHVEAALMRIPLTDADAAVKEALELLAWMVARGFLNVKAAVPCDENRMPVQTTAIFHEKSGIMEDRAGNRLAFSGSINETFEGWNANWDSFHVFTSWGGASDHVDAEEQTFRQLWTDRSRTALVIDIPAAVKANLLSFLPANDRLPARLETREKPTRWKTLTDASPESPPEPYADPRRIVWGFLKRAPGLPDGGERIGEATCAVTPWPHQIRAFQRMYENWPPRLLIADEVGLGKTIQAGLLLRQAWLAGKAERVLILAPKSLLRQWQIELREKFNLNWPIYDGKKLTWYPSPAFNAGGTTPVDADQWHREPFVLTSSQMMRREDRAEELLERAKPWDLLVLDEAHHARRRGGGADDERPSRLLRLMRRLKEKSKGLILLTATPMQVSPVEVWDLLNLIGLPSQWSAEAFLHFFETAGKPMPGNTELAYLAELFRAVESAYGPVSLEEARKFVPNESNLKAQKVLKALRDTATIPLRQLESPERRAAIRLMKANTPIRRLISRHTRERLRTALKEGDPATRLAYREIDDRFVSMSREERSLYESVEEYISKTYNQASPDKRSAVGFVMTVYRRRLASSFWALSRTLERRRKSVDEQGVHWRETSHHFEEDASDDDLDPETMDAEDAFQLESQALAEEEKGGIANLLFLLGKLPLDSKATVLLDEIDRLKAAGYRQVMVFSQYTDTLDFLRNELTRRFGLGSVLCFSGRGGELQEYGRGWRLISRDDIKKRFKERKADILLCSDAAAEGLNFQFCGAVINYDMPWNPMKVEQRIGRIDRLGQEHEIIRIVNFHYENTVETDVYRALRNRIELFKTFVGRLQPILAALPRALSEVTLAPAHDRERAKVDVVSRIAEKVDELEGGGFDLDEAAAWDWMEPQRPEPLYDLNDLGRILSANRLLPPGAEARQSGPKDYAYFAPGMSRPLRVTTDPEYFDMHPESTELWSPGSPLFPDMEWVDGSEEITIDAFKEALTIGIHSQDDQ